RIAQWHEIAQWYGFQSVPGFSEEISAFSPEDLWLPGSPGIWPSNRPVA
ncbi:hypothetical protein CK247_30710, partial [Klebsiella pneumoniae]